MTITVEDVKALIRSKIDSEREQAAFDSSRGVFESEAAEMCALRHWSDVHLHNQVLRRLLDEIESMDGEVK